MMMWNIAFRRKDDSTSVCMCRVCVCCVCGSRVSCVYVVMCVVYACIVTRYVKKILIQLDSQLVNLMVCSNLHARTHRVN